MVVKVVTDSTGDLPRSLAEQMGISVVPLNVHFGTETYRDGVELSPDAFYDRLVKGGRIPSTSQPTVGDFLQSYQELGETTDSIASIHISAKLSGTLNSANQAREQYQGAANIATLDSRQASMGLGLVALAAARAAQAGASLDEVMKAAEDAIPQVHFFGLLDTLTYLEKGGRIGKAHAFVGSLLQIKPVLVIREGEVQALGRVRTKAKGVDRICELVEESMPLEDLSVVYTTSQYEAHALAQRLGPMLPDGQVFISRMGPVVGTYAGPGALGVALRGNGGGSK